MKELVDQLNTPFLGEASPVFYMVVWPHGSPYIVDILEIMSKAEGVEPLTVFREDNVKLRSFVKELYRYDSVPYHHLRSKLRYLRRIKTGQTIFHIFFRVESPQYSIRGSGGFLHVRSERVNTLKWHLRTRFNPTENGEMTHNHIIHTNDTHIETIRQAEVVRNRLKKTKVYPRKKFEVLLPAHMALPRGIVAKKVYLEDLLVQVWVGDELRLMSIDETPHVRALKLDEPQGKRIYRGYIGENTGTRFQDGHNWVKFKGLFQSVNKNPKSILDHPIVVRWSQHESKYVVSDGLHRCAVAYQCGIRYLIAIVFSDQQEKKRTHCDNTRV